jgi:hypothetical protein
MFHFLNPSRRHRPARRLTAHRPLRLETLEHRYTLSGLSPTALDGPAELAEAAPAPPDHELRDSDSIQQATVVATSRPVIEDYDAWMSGDVLCVDGRVMVDGQRAAGLTVAIDWWDDSVDVETDSGGEFWYSVELEESGEGYVSAVTWNDVGESETAEEYVEYY